MRGLEGFEDLGKKTLQVRCCREANFLNLFSQTQRATVRWVSGCVVVRAWRKRALEQMTSSRFHLEPSRIPSSVCRCDVYLAYKSASQRGRARRGCRADCARLRASGCLQDSRAPVLIFTVLTRAYRDHTRSREVGFRYFSCQDHTCTPASGVWAFFYSPATNWA